MLRRLLQGATEILRAVITASIVLERKSNLTQPKNTTLRAATAAAPPALFPRPSRSALRGHNTLTPITDIHAAIGCPVDGPSIREKNRNNVDDLSNWLVNDHRGHFLVWNISDHRADSGGRGGRGGSRNGGGSGLEVSRKLHQRLLGQVLDVPWCSPNRRCYVPSVKHLLRICYSIKVRGGWAASWSRRGDVCCVLLWVFPDVVFSWQAVALSAFLLFEHAREGTMHLACLRTCLLAHVGGGWTGSTM